MATFTKAKSGYFQIQFSDLDKRRIRTVSLSQKKYSEETARGLHRIVESLIYKRENGIDVLDKKTQIWIESASPTIQEKLAKVDLIQVYRPHTVAELWEKVFHVKEHEEKLKEGSVENYRVAFRHFLSYFNENTLLTDFSKEQMLEWKQELLKQYEKTTVAGIVKQTKAVFNWAVANQWLQHSPMKGVPTGSYVNSEKDYEVTTREYEKLLAACPCLEWRGILALARIGGLRAPSEVLLLRWKDISWEDNKITVTSPKTEKQGKPKRILPLFPELRTILEELFSVSGSEEFVINIYRSQKTNLGTPFTRIAKKAGLGKIPRPFDNMRASRATEIYRKYGAKLESIWIGHSSKVAFRHYLMVTDDDYALYPKRQENALLGWTFSVRCALSSNGVPPQTMRPYSLIDAVQ